MFCRRSDEESTRTSQHMTARIVEGIVGDAVAGFGVVTIDGDFKPDLAAVVEPPARSAKLGVDKR
jgi:hypothetical protein